MSNSGEEYEARPFHLKQLGTEILFLGISALTTTQAQTLIFMQITANSNCPCLFDWAATVTFHYCYWEWMALICFVSLF